MSVSVSVSVSVPWNSSFTRLTYLSPTVHVRGGNFTHLCYSPFRAYFSFTLHLNIMFTQHYNYFPLPVCLSVTLVDCDDMVQQKVKFGK